MSVENAQFIGQVSDDYGINSLELIYYQQDLPTQENSISLKITNATTQTFNYRFHEEIIKRAIIELKDNQNLTQSEKLNIKQIKEDQLESGKYNLQAKLIENLTNEGKIKLQDIIYQISSQESLLINDNKDNTIKTDKILSNKKPQLIAEDNHLTDHKENINNLIEKIKNGQI